MKSYFHDKKGAITDAIFVPKFILITCITIFIALYVWFAFQGGMETVVENSPNNDTIIGVMDEIRASIIAIDYMIPVLVGGLLIVSLIFAFKTGASILYAFVSLFFWAFALLMAAVFTNIFEQFETTFPVVAAELPILVFVMSNMKWIVLIWLVLISIVMFTRNKSEDQQLRQYAGVPEAIYEQ